MYTHISASSIRTDAVCRIDLFPIYLNIFPVFIMLLIALLSPNPFIPLKNQYYIYVIDMNGTDTFTVKKKVSS